MKNYKETSDMEEVERLQREGHKVVGISSSTPQIFTIDMGETIDKPIEKVAEKPVEVAKPIEVENPVVKPAVEKKVKKKRGK